MAEDMTFAEARGRLLQIADLLDEYGYDGHAEELRKIEKRVARRKARKVARPRSRAVTDELVVKIKTLRKEFPTWSLQKIGDTVGVNMARVSEVLHGKR
jgi:hypothetical protein